MILLYSSYSSVATFMAMLSSRTCIYLDRVTMNAWIMLWSMVNCTMCCSMSSMVTSVISHLWLVFSWILSINYSITKVYPSSASGGIWHPLISSWASMYNFEHVSIDLVVSLSALFPSYWQWSSEWISVLLSTLEGW